MTDVMHPAMFLRVGDAAPAFEPNPSLVILTPVPRHCQLITKPLDAGMFEGHRSHGLLCVY
jgi:hypothetical protein